jgi:hypothetical protein
MPDDLRRRRPQDSSRININEPYEVEYWTQTLGVTESKLRRAVDAVGTSVEAVRKWLREH